VTRGSDQSTVATLNRALPGWAVDAISLGVSDSYAYDGRKVWGMCVSIAMSAYVRGWSEPQFVGEIMSMNTRLWTQLMRRSDGRMSSKLAAHKSLCRAWETGVANIRNVGNRTQEEIHDDAVELAHMWADRLDDSSNGLSITEIAVMRYVVAQTERRGMLRVTCPGRDVAEFAAVPHRTAARTLSRLATRGLLVKHSSGRRGEAGKGKAAIYGLADPTALAHSHGGNIPMCHPEPCPTAESSQQRTG